MAADRSLKKLTEVDDATRNNHRGFCGSRCTPCALIAPCHLVDQLPRICFEIDYGILVKHDEVSAKGSYGQDSEVSAFSLRYWLAQG
jgi:hypothetical protein